MLAAKPIGRKLTKFANLIVMTINGKFHFNRTINFGSPLCSDVFDPHAMAHVDVRKYSYTTVTRRTSAFVDFADVHRRVCVRTSTAY